MQFSLNAHRALRWLLVAAFLSFGIGFAMAESEPTMAEIYSTAQAGRLDQAQAMVQRVLAAHPNSAKAYYVQSELMARQGKLDRARESLATAEKLEPGLPFAKPDAVAALRAELAPRPVVGGNSGYGSSQAVQYSEPAPRSGGWMLPALLAGGVIVAAFFFFRRREPVQVYDQGPYPVATNGLNGPQQFGNVPNGPYNPYGPAGGQPMYGQPQGTGLGGRIMGGVATGLAVGAGVVAAEAIGRNLMGNHDGGVRVADNYTGGEYQNPPINSDMGGQNFGINDTSSWDDGGSMGGGGSDWDT